MINKNKRSVTVPGLIIFLSVISFLLFEANLLFYKTFVSIFGIESQSDKNFLIWFLLIFSGGFIVMLIVEKYSASFLTKTLYYITAVWTGLFGYLFLASASYNILNLFFNAKFLGLLFFDLAVLLGLYGFLHHRKIFVKKVEVELKNLPESWKGRTAVWVSDLHLGSIHGSKLSERVTKISNSLSPDIVFIGGDLFDGTQAPDLKKLSAPLRNLSSKFGTFFVAGNHEEFGGSEAFFDVVRELDIKILNDEKIEIEGLQIVGVDYASCSKGETFEKVLKGLNIDKERASVLLKHEPKDLNIAEAENISMQISGHTHNGQQWPFGYLAKWAYKGHNYGLKDFGKMKVLVSSGVGSWGPPIRVGTDCEVVHIIFK